MAFANKHKSYPKKKNNVHYGQNRIMKHEKKKELIMNKKPLSTYERIMQDPKRKAAFDLEYKQFALSELMLALMTNDEKSVRKLAKEAGLSPTVIQNIRSGKQKDIKLENFKNIVKACGYNIVLEKGTERIPVG